MATCPACKGEFDARFCPRDGNRLIDQQMLADRYRLLRKVGEGAMGEVWEAEHVHLSRRVAVKLLQRKIASDAEAAARLQREARSTTGLGHPNVVDTIDFGFADGQAFLVMEWLDGENLDQRLARGPLDVATAIDIARQAAAGVAAAHDRGVIHCDLKPANLFLTRDHRGELLVKVLDFGIAKLVLHETKLTATGVLIGTPNYMAPEQAEGNPIDARTDVYAIGVILYEMLTGTVPFLGETPLSVLHQHTSRLPILPSARAPERAIPEALDDVVMRCLAKRLGERFPTMRAVGDALAELAETPVKRSPAPRTTAAPTARVDEDDLVVVAQPHRRAWLVIVGAAVLIVAGIVVVTRKTETRRPVAVSAASVPPDAALAAPPRLVDASAAPSDAAQLTRPLDDAAGDLAMYSLRGQHVAGTLTVHPALPVAGTRVELDVELSDLDASLRAAQATRTLVANVVVEYYKTDTAVAPAYTTQVDASGRFAVSVPIVHAAKHHVHIDLLVDGKEVDHVKANLWPDLL